MISFFQYVSFPASETSVSFSESVVVGTRRLLEPATTFGGGGLERLTYTIASGNQDNHFRLVSGEYLLLETLRPLDRELKDSYLLNITARATSATAYTLVKVKIF